MLDHFFWTTNFWIISLLCASSLFVTPLFPILQSWIIFCVTNWWINIPLAMGVGTRVFLPAKIFFVGFHEFRSEMGVFDGAEHDADIFFHFAILQGF